MTETEVATPRIDEARNGQRRCLVTGAGQDRAALLRFVVDPAGIVVPDIAEKLPGRGAWLRAERTVIVQAVQRRLLPRAFEAAAQVPADLIDRCAALLERHLLNLLGLAKKAGGLALGQQPALDALRTGGAHLLLLAADASPREARPLQAAALAAGISVATLPPAAQLGPALGRERTAYVAVLRANLVPALLQAAARWQGLQQEKDDKSALEAQKDVP